MFVAMEISQFHIAQMGLFWGQYFYLLEGVPQNNLTPMRSCPEDARLVLFDHLGTKEFKCFYFWYIDSVTHCVGIASKNGHFDDS